MVLNLLNVFSKLSKQEILSDIYIFNQFKLILIYTYIFLSLIFI